MPALNSIVLTDGTTPLTLTPRGGSANGKSIFMSANAATREAQSKVTVQFSENKASARVNFRLDTPITSLDADTGRTSVIEHNIAQVDIRVPLVATQAERLQFVKRVFSCLSDATLASVLQTGEELY